jgi:hypothetical protein
MARDHNGYNGSKNHFLGRELIARTRWLACQLRVHLMLVRIGNVSKEDPALMDILMVGTWNATGDAEQMFSFIKSKSELRSWKITQAIQNLYQNLLFFISLCSNVKSHSFSITSFYHFSFDRGTYFRITAPFNSNIMFRPNTTFLSLFFFHFTLCGAHIPDYQLSTE